MNTRLSTVLGLGTFLLLSVPAAHAAPLLITYTFKHHILSLSVAAHPEWKETTEVWKYRGRTAIPPSRFKTCGVEDVVENGWTRENASGWNEDSIARSIAREISVKIDRPAGRVVIAQSGSGITFDGRGLPGQRVDTALAASLTKQALEQNVNLVILPVETSPATVLVQEPDLRAEGIKEVVMVGESVFAKSPVNRRHNIGVGLSKFNGHLIPQGAVFSFVEVLGRVDASTGYRKELVIQGEETLPDYGGGLCQVSSTAYRGPWEYGLPIVQRKNHSYAVSYYSPQGTDATIYPPNVDMKFTNDTPGALLIQTFFDEQDRAYFIYYGTKDDRQTEVFGPYVTDRVAAPKEEKISYTTEIPRGKKRKAGERHDGMKVMWYRSVTHSGTGSVFERFFSAYQARPLYWQVGVTPDEMERRTDDDLSETPSWLPTRP